VVLRSPVVAGFLVVLGACSFTGGYETGYRCGDGDTCPEGQSCLDGVCVLSSGDDDASPDGDIGTASRCGTTALLRDDFADPARAIDWDSFAETGTTIAETGGVLAVTIANNSIGWAGYTSAFTYDLRGSAFEVAVPQVGNRYTLIEVRSQNDEKAQIVVDSGELVAVLLNTPDVDRPASIPYDASMHKFWRIREAGGQLYWEWSSDRSSWNELHHQGTPFDVQHVYPGLAAGEHLASLAIPSQFDDVDLPAQVPDEGFCAAGTLGDDFASSPIDPQWDYWSDAHCTTSIVGGALQLDFDGAIDSWCGIGSWHLYDLSDSQVVVDAADVPGSAGFTTYLQLTEPRDDTSHLLIGRQGPDLIVEQSVSNTNVDFTTVAYDAVAMRYWRIRGAGGHVYFDTSPDGTATSWTNQLDTTAQLDLSKMVVAIGGGRYAAGNAVAVSFGAVNP